MSLETDDMRTDAAWEAWGRRDPYFGVITEAKYRSINITAPAKKEFFESGHHHVEYVIRVVRSSIDPSFQPQSILDFGCGVGRTLPSFASIASEVVGLDVSASMLEEARRNVEQGSLRNVRLLRSDDLLSELHRDFDLIHSFIVFQHIPVRRGRVIFSKLLEHLSPGGVGAFHFTYSKISYAPTHGVAPPLDPSAAAVAIPEAVGADPEMQMNPYNINELLFLIQQRGVQRIQLDFTDHGGEFGVFLFFQRSFSSEPKVPEGFQI